jgi:hypothetical protein
MRPRGFKMEFVERKFLEHCSARQIAENMVGTRSGALGRTTAFNARPSGRS